MKANLLAPSRVLLKDGPEWLVCRILDILSCCYSCKNIGIFHRNISLATLICIGCIMPFFTVQCMTWGPLGVEKAAVCDYQFSKMGKWQLIYLWFQVGLFLKILNTIKSWIDNIYTCFNGCKEKETWPLKWKKKVPFL